jgi:hypothetical protein
MVKDDTDSECWCGLDTSKDGFRYDIVCPKHDGVVWKPMPETAP